LQGWKYKNKKVKDHYTNEWITPNGEILVTKKSVNEYLKDKGEKFRLPEGRLIRKKKESYFLPKNQSSSRSRDSSSSSSEESPKKSEIKKKNSIKERERRSD